MSKIIRRYVSISRFLVKNLDLHLSKMVKNTLGGSLWSKKKGIIDSCIVR